MFDFLKEEMHKILINKFSQDHRVINYNILMHFMSVSYFLWILVFN